MRFLAILLLLASAVASGQSNLPDAPHIYVEGSAEVQVAPDTLRLTGRISSTSLDAAEAERSVYEKSAILLKACKDHDIDSDQISSSTVSMSPRYEYSGRRQTLIGYELSRTFDINLSSLDMYYPALRAIVESGAASNLDAVFTVSESEPSITRAQQLAIDDARARAERLAHQANMALGATYSITEFNLRAEERASLRPQRFLFEADLAGGVDEIIVTASRVDSDRFVQPLFEPSTVAVTATVFVVYTLEKM